jgi:hypothetical protein
MLSVSRRPLLPPLRALCWRIYWDGGGLGWLTCPSWGKLEKLIIYLLLLDIKNSEKCLYKIIVYHRTVQYRVHYSVVSTYDC